MDNKKRICLSSIIAHCPLSIVHCAIYAFLSQLLTLSSPIASTSAFTWMDSLFLTAATGEPRFQAARDSCEKILIALDTVTLGYLIAGAARDRTPRQRQYVERLFTVLADSGRNPAPRRALEGAVSVSVNDTVRAQWLYIGSRMADTAFRASAPAWLDSPSEAVRRMAVRTLGAYPSPENLPWLWSGLDSLRGLELHQRLWALEAHSPLHDWSRLVPLLENAHYFNRQKVRDMLLKATDSSWAALSAAIPKDPHHALRREWWRLALDARGGGEFLESERAAMTAEEICFLGMWANPPK
jgi:hypothetical protein